MTAKELIKKLLQVPDDTKIEFLVDFVLIGADDRPSSFEIKQCLIDKKWRGDTLVPTPTYKVLLTCR